MGRSTLQGWCTPTEFTDAADHTFVYCPENDRYFRCWGGGNITAKDTVKVCSGRDSDAYCRADKYRASVGNLPDTAGVGIYAVNGVCHQSANLFLYSAGVILPLNKPRPRGIIVSHAMYGVYGTDIPGPTGAATWHLHFGRWYALFYAQAKARCLFAIKEAGSVQAAPLFQKIQQLHHSHFLRAEAPRTTHNAIVKEFGIVAGHIAPKVDPGRFEDIHRDLLKEKDAILRSSKICGDIPEKIKLPQGQKAVKLVEQLNDLACQFQKSLAERIGPTHYKQLTGNKPTEIYRIIDPKIAVESWKNH